MLAGLLLRLNIWEQPKSHQLFDDASYWNLPEEGFPSASEGQQVETNDKTQTTEEV